jgi:hypothetical protein
MNKNIIFIFVLSFIFIYILYNTSIISEDYNNYYAKCNIQETLQTIANKYNMKKDEKDWMYYFSCNLNRAEIEILEFEKETQTKKLFIIDGCDFPASKMALWTLLKEMYKENVNTIMPTSYLLNYQTDFEEIKQHFDNNTKKRPGHMYILKNYEQQQKGLRIVNKYEDIMDGYKNGFYLVQDYLYNPYLINKHKINFRYYTLIVCRNDTIEGYIHENGFVYYTPEYYDPDSTDFNKHITTGYIDRKIYNTNPLTLDDFRAYLNKQESGSADVWNKNVNKLMKDVITACAVKVCKNEKLKKHIRFQIFGSDIAPTNDLSAYLMEINKGPDLNAKDERDKQVKLRVQSDIFKIVDPIDSAIQEKTRFIRIL